MKKLLILLLVSFPIIAFGQFPGLAKTPPMGWNSWNAFGLNINSKIVMSVADAMVSKGMAKAGYEYIVIDDGWQIDRDKNGVIIVDSSRFPEGMKFLADYIHSRGLKFGIYTCCGTKTCGGRPGSYGYEEIDAKTYASWGVDFIKEDWCNTDGMDTRVQYKKMSDAIRATGRPMLLSLCEWGVSAPWEWASGVGAMWRTTNDIQDCFDCVRDWGGMGWVPILEKNANLAPYAGPGHWNDPDMLEVGNRSLNPTECRSHFAMWCMLAAPLLAGNNISTMNDTIRDILTAPEIIAVNQDASGIQGTRIRNNAGLQVWQKPLQDGSIAVALLNVSPSDADMFVSLEEIGFRKGVKATVRDLWGRKDLEAVSDTFRAKVVSHGVVVVKIKSSEKTTSASISFAESSFRLNKGNHKLIQLSVTPAGLPIQLSSANPGIADLSIAGVNLYRLSANNTGSTVLKAFTLDGKVSKTSTVQVVASTVPASWKMNEINIFKASVFYEKGVFSIEGAGSDIWSATDQFAFLNTELAGDNFITAQIISQTCKEPWAKTGLMFRESTATNSAYVMICVTPGNGINLQWRDSTGAKAMGKPLGGFTLPAYFKLARSSSNFRVFKSSDGSHWNLLGEVTMKPAFSQRYLAGIAVTSHDTQLLNLSKLSDVQTGAVEK